MRGSDSPVIESMGLDAAPSVDSIEGLANENVARENPISNQRAGDNKSVGIARLIWANTFVRSKHLARKIKLTTVN